MAKKKEKAPEPEPEGMSPWLWLVPVLAILDLLYYIAMSLGYLPTLGFSMDKWKIATASFQGVLLVALAVSHALDRRAAPCEEETAEVKPEYIETKERPARPKAEKKVIAPPPARSAPVPAPPPRPSGKEIIEYPEKVSGGIYADTKLPLGDGRYLKFRTLVARSCILCDEQDHCWNIVRHDVEEEFFKGNIDCKQGLGIEG